MPRLTRTTRLALTAAGLLAAALAVSGCGVSAAATPDGENADGLQTIRLQDATEYTSLPLRFAEENGIFEDQGLKVDWVQTDDNVVSAGSGDVTIAFGPTNSHLRAAAQGAPIRIVAAGFRTKGPFWLIGGKGIHSVEDLKGKKVGIAVPGSGLETYALEILKAHGIKASDVTTVASGVFDKAYGAVTTGQVDATIIHQPFAALGELEGKTTTLARGWDYLPTYQTGDIIAGTKTIAEHPELLRKALRAYFTAYDYAKTHYDEYVPWLTKKLPAIAPEAVEKAIELEDVIWENNAALDLDAVDKSQDVEIAVGHQDKRFDVDKYTDLRFIPEEFVKEFTYPDPKDAE
ncbi:ABC transporter substrate-binding protein [Microbacterium sp. NPDC057659]|uniref:ABC transporter substrate-binding protein n=1 Tax=Microbacterium sp. NPDC057659 TaxID=3346198 RepID=UPI00366B844A